MNFLTRGLLSAAGAGLLLALLMWIQGALGVLPALDLIGMLARVLGEQRDAAWALYAAVTMLGFGLALPVLADEDGRAMVPALGLAATGWFATMMALLPMAGYSPFGVGLSWAVPVLTLAQAAAFGLAMGLLFEQLPRLAVRSVQPTDAFDSAGAASALAAARATAPTLELPAIAVPATLATPVLASAASARPPRDRLRAARASVAATLQRLADATGPQQSLPGGRA